IHTVHLSSLVWCEHRVKSGDELSFICSPFISLKIKIKNPSVNSFTPKLLSGGGSALWLGKNANS
ncbi:hypothetical protein, partial [Candidatus Regiella insecticola]|uniref:hypothetical protein n=1 Tax=Candidatus Regiella insecticola TaxID=138073 RepID=UPI001ED8F0E5